MPSNTRRLRPRKLLAGAVVAMLSLCAVPALAEASCPSAVGSEVFAPIGDHAAYALMPGSTFEEGTSGWTLTNATVATGNQSYAYAAGGSHSLAVQSNGIAVSRAFCVSSEYPSFRFFARRSSGSWGNLNVWLRWKDAYGYTHETGAGFVQAYGTSWSATPRLALASALQLWMYNSTLNVQLVFRPESYGETWDIDDVYIDPYSR
jgi:hypothetical protein